MFPSRKRLSDKWSPHSQKAQICHKHQFSWKGLFTLLFSSSNCFFQSCLFHFLAFKAFVQREVHQKYLHLQFNANTSSINFLMNLRLLDYHMSSSKNRRIQKNELCRTNSSTFLKRKGSDSNQLRFVLLRHIKSNSRYSTRNIEGWIEFSVQQVISQLFFPFKEKIKFPQILSSSFCMTKSVKADLEKDFYIHFIFACCSIVKRQMFG